MVVENFEKKIIANKELQESEKRKKYSNFGKNLNSLTLKVITSEPIQITDEDSAKERITHGKYPNDEREQNLKSGMIKNLFQKSNMQEDDMDLDMKDSESNESDIAN
ncbi:unnamed protein product [Rhizophagus irregularis]|nr:unnamed protein product [Rhizophagus irregularis]